MRFPACKRKPQGKGERERSVGDEVRYLVGREKGSRRQGSVDWADRIKIARAIAGAGALRSTEDLFICSLAIRLLELFLPAFILVMISGHL